MLTVVGEITESEVQHLPGPPYRPARPTASTRPCSTDGPSLRMSFFAKAKHVSDWHAGRLPVGPARHLHRPGQQLPQPVAADQPDHGAVRGRRLRRDVRGRRRLDQGALPALPARPRASTRGTCSAPSRSPSPIVDDVPDPLPDDAARRARPARPDDGVPAGPRPRLVGAGHRGPAPVPVRRGAGDPAGAGPTPCGAGPARRPGPGRRRRPAGRVRRAAAVHPDPGAGGGLGRDHGRPGPAPPDEPPAPGRGRLRQDAGRAAGHAPGRRLRRPGRAARADRGARPAAPPVDHRHARRPGRRRHARRRGRGDPGRPAHRLDVQGGPAGGDARRRLAARRASSSAPTPCSRSTSRSPTSGSSWSTSSTGSASSSAPRSPTRPAPRPTSW